MIDTEAIEKSVSAALAAGENPNHIAGIIQAATEYAINVWADANGWSRWGDGDWLEDAACSICGSSVPGICGHERSPQQVVLRGLEAVAVYERFAQEAAK